MTSTFIITTIILMVKIKLECYAIQPQPGIGIQPPKNLESILLNLILILLVYLNLYGYLFIWTK